MERFNIVFIFLVLFTNDINNVHCGDNNGKRSHNQIVEYMMHRNFPSKRTCTSEGGVPYLVPMLAEIIKLQMTSDVVVILYDEYFYISSHFQTILENLLKVTEVPIRHGILDTNLAKPRVPEGFFDANNLEQLSFIIFAKEIDVGGEVLVGRSLITTKLILISQSSTYQIKEFLGSKQAREIVNLLVVVDLTLKVDTFTQRKRSKMGECDIILYSHKLYADTLGNSYPMIVTAWRRTHFTRPDIVLFPDKLRGGLNGLHLVASASDKPPFVFRKRNQETSEGYVITAWEGLEIRLIKLLGDIMNFTVEFKEPTSMLTEEEDGADTVLNELAERRVDLALGGVYMTSLRHQLYSFMYPHTQDCASFISLTSTALPKYRAIMGPFLWDVWLALTVTYLLAIVPISFSEWHTFRPIIDDPKELENMFWYVFGTFTNCFAFSGQNSWSKGNKTATKFFIGLYWLFTIIITACYTGSIIAFITLPVFPEVIDTTKQLVQERYKLSTIKSGGWPDLINETSDPMVLKLLPDMDLVTDYTEGLKNVTGNVYADRKSAFLGSKHLLEYVARVNFTPTDSNKRLLFHISKECFTPLLVSVAFPQRTSFMENLNVALHSLTQAGFITKITREVHWIVFRSTTGKLLQGRNSDLRSAPVEDRQLTLDDTQGMFLLLGAGFAIAVAALTGEIIIWVRKETSYPPEFGKPTLSERIYETLGQWGNNCKSCLLAPANVHDRLSRLFQERRESRINSQLSELFGSEVSFNFYDDRTYNEVKSDIHLKAPKPELPIRLRSF